MIICPSIGQQLLYLIYSNCRNSGRSETYQRMQVRGIIRSEYVFGKMVTDQQWTVYHSFPQKITPSPETNKSRFWSWMCNYHKQTLQLMVNIFWKPKQNRKHIFSLDQSVWKLLCIFFSCFSGKTWQRFYFKCVDINVAFELLGYKPQALRQ